jgi:hypothetical protein
MMVMGGISAVGSIMGGIGGKQAADYNAKVAEAQAGVARENAALESERVIARGKATASTARANAAASGVEVGMGSALDAELASIAAASRDAAIIHRTGALKAWGLEAEAKNQRWIGGNTLMTGFITSGANLAGGWGSAQLAGKPGGETVADLATIARLRTLK